MFPCHRPSDHPAVFPFDATSTSRTMCSYDNGGICRLRAVLPGEMNSSPNPPDDALPPVNVIASSEFGALTTILNSLEYASPSDPMRAAEAVRTWRALIETPTSQRPRVVPLLAPSIAGLGVCRADAVRVQVENALSRVARFLAAAEMFGPEAQTEVRAELPNAASALGAEFVPLSKPVLLALSSTAHTVGGLAASQVVKPGQPMMDRGKAPPLSSLWLALSAASPSFDGSISLSLLEAFTLARFGDMPHFLGEVAVSLSNKFHLASDTADGETATSDIKKTPLLRVFRHLARTFRCRILVVLADPPFATDNLESCLVEVAPFAADVLRTLPVVVLRPIGEAATRLAAAAHGRALEELPPELARSWECIIHHGRLLPLDAEALPAPSWTPPSTVDEKSRWLSQCAYQSKASPSVFEGFDKQAVSACVPPPLNEWVGTTAHQRVAFQDRYRAKAPDLWRTEHPDAAIVSGEEGLEGIPFPSLGVSCLCCDLLCAPLRLQVDGLARPRRHFIATTVLFSLSLAVAIATAVISGTTARACCRAPPLATSNSSDVSTFFARFAANSTWCANDAAIRQWQLTGNVSGTYDVDTCAGVEDLCSAVGARLLSSHQWGRISDGGFVRSSAGAATAAAVMSALGLLLVSLTSFMVMRCVAVQSQLHIWWRIAHAAKCVCAAALVAQVVYLTVELGALQRTKGWTVPMPACARDDIECESATLQACGVSVHAVMKGNFGVVVFVLDIVLCVLSGLAFLACAFVPIYPTDGDMATLHPTTPATLIYSPGAGAPDGMTPEAMAAVQYQIHLQLTEPPSSTPTAILTPGATGYRTQQLHDEPRPSVKPGPRPSPSTAAGKVLKAMETIRLLRQRIEFKKTPLPADVAATIGRISSRVSHQPWVINEPPINGRYAFVFEDGRKAAIIDGIANRIHQH